VGRLTVTWAVLAFAAAVLLGMLLTMVMGQDPGFLLGLFLIVGSAGAAAAVRRGAAYKFIPLPALGYLVTATLAGMAHDTESLNSSRQFVLDFLTWIGGSFVAVTASTILVVLIALSRWLLASRLVSGQLPAVGRAGFPRAGFPRAGFPRAGFPRTAPRPAGRDPWGDRDSRDDRDPRDDRIPRSGRDHRDDRGSRGNSDPWRNQDRRDDRGRRGDGTWPGQAFRGDRERRDHDTWAGQGMQDDRDTWGGRPPGGDPRERRPRDERDDGGPYDDRDPRSPSGPRDLW
jgi:hypothetical protein